jgi:phytanoyl-CoA hydroxylase
MVELSLEQVRFFRNSGYFKLSNVLSSAETAVLREFVTKQKEIEELKRLATGDTRDVVKMYGLYDRDPLLIQSLITHPNLLGPLRSILGPNVVYVTNRHNHATINDQASTKGEARLHRDILQPTRGLLTAAVYLEESTLDNGCTHLIPHSQYFHYVGVPQIDGGGTWMDAHGEYEGLLEQALPVPMPEGGVLLFDGLAFHSVGVNRSDKTRSSMTLGFRSVDELDVEPDVRRQILVSGEFLYRGNDKG